MRYGILGKSVWKVIGCGELTEQEIILIDSVSPPA